MIPDAAVEHHWLLFEDDGRWGCQGCNWTGEKIDDYWAAHETRRTNDNIPF